MKTRKTPRRKCVGCGEQFDKRNLVRIVHSKEEGVCIDLTGKKNGRGAYICKNIDCFQSSVKKNALSRALGIDVDDDVSEAIRKEILGSKWKKVFFWIKKEYMK